MSFHLLACISAHGFGHFAMTAPVLNRIKQLYDIKLSVRTRLPEHLITSRIEGEVDVIPEVSDFGMIMHSSLDVDLPASIDAYKQFHHDWPEKIHLEAEKLKSYNADLIIANIPYLTVAAAKQANIPCIAYCSLNWADIFQHYFDGGFDGADDIVQQMRDAYNSATVFVCPEPAMEMTGLKEIIRIGPVAKLGNNQSAKIRQQLNIDDKKKLVLITPGGVDTPVPVNSWPAFDDIHWLCSWEYESNRTDITPLSKFSCSFNDMLTSCDAVITKPGYGTVAETVCNHVPALYVLRGDWAEELFLARWWQEKGNIEEISREQFFSGEIRNALESLWSQTKKTPVKPQGIDQLAKIAADFIPAELKKNKSH